MGIPCGLNPDFTQHLTNNDLNVLVIDLHALESIDILHLGHHKVNQLLNILVFNDFRHDGWSFNHHLALFHRLTFENIDPKLFGDQLLVGLAVRICDHQSLLALGLFSIGDNTC